ncbi:MAG: helix-hairpin-helix domain-containing protein [Candidatus Diapherotrites archaeon]|nr:helix-hairpin-helix domain-containing protein [Candidatus Diapherotrites archaeon]
MVEIQKVKALAEAGKYDLSCSCNEERKDIPKIKSDYLSMVYKASMPDNKFIYLFKTLYSNACVFDCKYCSNSSVCKNKLNKFSYTPQELANTFDLMKRKGLVSGLFLSSAMSGEADKVMESMIEATEIIRFKQKFNGYIHLKVLPGTNYDLVKRATELAQRVSINIEATSNSRLNELSSQKEFQTDLIKRQKWIQKLNDSSQTTQLVVGACAGETDKEILNTMDYEYKEIGIEKMYYSAFKPLKNTPLEEKKAVNPLRQVRLYNSDYLYRLYNFKKKELFEVLDENGFLPRTEPKTVLAVKNNLCIEPNTCDYSELIRVPGIGLKTASKISEFRKKEKIHSRKQLQELGVILKRADSFIELNGWKQGKIKEWS